MRTTLGVLGNTAPFYSTLKDGDGNPLYPGQDWDYGSGWPIWMHQRKNTYYSQADIYLERVVQGLVPESWVCIEQMNVTSRFYKISSMIERVVSVCALSAKTNGLTLKTSAGTLLGDNTTDKPTDFTIRAATVHLQSEKLTLAELPFDEDLDSDPARLELDGLVLGLNIGQSVNLSGERSDTPGVSASEILTIKAVEHVGGFTVLTFESGREYVYLRSTVTLNANTVSATHGETVKEILGSGDGAQRNQRFTLKKPPLTYVPAATSSGSASTLKLRVDNLLWDEAASLYGLGSNDQDYIIRIDEDPTNSVAGVKATVIFGDGEAGGRLPTGQTPFCETASGFGA